MFHPCFIRGSLALIAFTNVPPTYRIETAPDAVKGPWTKYFVFQAAWTNRVPRVEFDFTPDLSKRFWRLIELP